MTATTAEAARRPGPRAPRLTGAVRITVLVAVLAVVLYPLLWVLGSSLKSPTELASNISVWPTDVTWANYTEGWNFSESLSFGRFFLNSTLIALATVVANAASCLVTAYAFARLRFRGRGVWFSVMIATLLLPGHVLVIPQYVLFESFGWVDSPLPLIVPKLLATEAFFVFLMVQFMRGIPRDLDDAARIDGCSPFGVFRYVILPLSRPALVTTAIFSFIWTWNDFFTQLVYLPSPDSYTVPIGLRLFIDSGGQTSIGPMLAMSVLSLAPVFLFFLAFQRFLVQGINTTGLKG
ncbi:carbohydrate ABC transporter permease [Phytomonospora endophytica]|uniref:Multiple sugar transport system permease protein n=1 Tax=Phytomonospora endophytica TaxID=714109 RepID=A0A841FQX2_9ACTN|nr:carbohydrate ABC transporter permease [Phytomonospora endophytica]MBB6034360.1 multiple sugar transport system permease protein [Phytomonospora endophytica]GIG66753.1 sugar ABC transporter permease [Phytomonospora endophytica]